jgi:hypothetical protein
MRCPPNKKREISIRKQVKKVFITCSPEIESEILSGHYMGFGAGGKKGGFCNKLSRVHPYSCSGSFVFVSVSQNAFPGASEEDGVEQENTGWAHGQRLSRYLRRNKGMGINPRMILRIRTECIEMLYGFRALEF